MLSPKLVSKVLMTVGRKMLYRFQHGVFLQRGEKRVFMGAEDKPSLQPQVPVLVRVAH